jgi:hypothetical protein
MVELAAQNKIDPNQIVSNRLVAGRIDPALSAEVKGAVGSLESIQAPDLMKLPKRRTVLAAPYWLQQPALRPPSTCDISPVTNGAPSR